MHSFAIINHVDLDYPKEGDGHVLVHVLVES